MREKGRSNRRGEQEGHSLRGRRDLVENRVRKRGTIFKKSKTFWKPLIWESQIVVGEKKGRRTVRSRAKGLCQNM